MGNTPVPAVNGQGHTIKKGLTYSPATNPPTLVSSIFQEIARGSAKPKGIPNRLLYRDDACVIFMAYKGESKTHLLVVPNRIVKTWVDLVAEGLGTSNVPLPELQGKALLDHMVAKGQEYAEAGPDNEFRIAKEHMQMGFHSPPFNSIDHLHLHVLDRSKWRSDGKKKWKFPQHIPTPWFRTVDDVIAKFG